MATTSPGASTWIIPEPEERAGSPLSSVPFWVRAVLFGIAYWALAVLGAWLSQPGRFASFWLPSGLYVAALLLHERRRWPWLVATAVTANLVFDLFNGQRPQISLLFACGNSTEALTGAWLVSRALGACPRFSTSRDVVVFTLLSAALSTTISATIGATVLTTLLGKTGFLRLWLLWWSGDFMGVLLIGPLAIAWLNRPLFSVAPVGERGERFAFLVVAVTSAAVIFQPGFQEGIALKFLMFPIVLWAAFRFGLRVTTACTVVTALFSSMFSGLDSSPALSPGQPPEVAMILSQSFLAVMALTGLFVRATVAERELTESTLQRSEALLRSVTDGTSDAIYVKDSAGRYLLFNEAAARFVGKPASEVLGKTDLALFPAHEAKSVIEGDQGVMGSGATQTYEESIHTVRGKSTFLSTKGPVRDRNGNVVGLFGIARDITGRKDLEERLRQAQKLEAVGQLAGGVAHDFNNILAALMMHVSLLQLDRRLDREIQQSLKELMVEAKRGANLTRQLLMFSRRSVLEIKALDLNDVVENLLKMLRRLIGEDVMIHFQRGDAVGAVEADPGLIEQVLVNLCVNARDAMPTGGRITIRLRGKADRRGPCKDPCGSASRCVRLSLCR